MRVYRSWNSGPRRAWSLAAVAALVTIASCTRSGDEALPDTTVPATGPTTTTEPPLVLGPGVDEGLIHLGAVLPLSGARAPLGEAVLAGHEAYWAYVNEELGGVDGFEVEVVAEDSQYQLDIAASAAERLATATLALSSVLGSPITEALGPVVDRHDLLAAAGAQVSDWGSDPALLLDLALTSYRDQVRVGLEWAASSGTAGEGAKAGLIAQESVYGDDCAEGFRLALDESAYTEGEVIRHEIAQTEFTAEVTAAQEAGIEVLVLCTLPDGLLSMVGTAELNGYEPLILATAASYDTGIPAALGGDGGEESGLDRLAGLLVLGALEETGDTSPGLRLYGDNLTRVGLDPQESWYTFLGYTQAGTMHIVLQEAFDAGDVSRAGLMAVAESVPPVDFGFGAGPVAFDDEGVPSAVDALGRPVAAGDSLFGLERVSGFVRLDEA